MRKLALWALAAFLLLPFSLQGSLLTSATGGTTTTFSGGDYCFGSQSTGSSAGFGITASSGACYNYSQNFGFDSNGEWNWELVAEITGGGMITIDLGGLYSSVGGFMNYAPGYGTPVISALAGDGVTVLESYDLSSVAPIFTPAAVNGGAFRGISRSSADIAYFQFGGSFSAMHDITLDDASAVPEPSTLLLSVFALAGLGLLRRARC